MLRMLESAGEWIAWLALLLAPAYVAVVVVRDWLWSRRERGRDEKGHARR